MASSYINNLRLDEMATGDGSGTWGTTTNTNLTLIGEAFGYATKAIADASTATLTIPDGTETNSEPRAMYLKLTGGGQACTVTLAPNTASKVWIIENVTSYTLTFTQGSGANVAILAGETKMIATDGAGSGAVVYDVLTDLNLAGTTKTAALTNAGALSNQGTVTVGVDDTGYDVKLFGATSGKYLLWDESADSLIVTGSTSQQGTLTVGVDDTGYDVKLFGATSGKYWLWDESADGVLQYSTLTVGVDDTGYDVKFFGATSGAYMLWDESADDLKLVGAAGLTVAADIDVDGTANLDVVDIDGATQADGTITVGVDDTGYDVKLFGATSGAYMLWDESADDLKLVGAAGLTVAGDADIDGTTNLDAVDIDGAVQADGTITVGVDDTGYDVKFFGATASAYMLWDESADDLILAGAARVVVPASGLVIASTAVSSTAAELNLLDGLDRGSILYGNASSATTVLGQGSADQVLTSDGTDISWEDASGGGATDLNGLSDCKTFGTDSLMLGDATTGTIDAANYNTGLGINVFASLTTADNNTAVGYGALDANLTGNSNTAVGKDALGANTGAGNTAVGFVCLDANTSSSNETGVGYNCLGANVGGANNTAYGSECMAANVSGAYNVAVGQQALSQQTTLHNNVAVGQNALLVANATGNTAVGGYAGNAVTSRGNNTFLGIDAGQSGSPGGAITTASNEVCIGDENVTAANIQVDWTIASDKRDKTDVEPIKMGLSFINKLEPVTYKWDKRSLYVEKGEDFKDLVPDGTHKEEWLDTGFLAQDVEVLESEYGYNIADKTNLTTTLSDDGNQYGLTYTKFTPMLVKAIQELSAKVEELEKQLNNKE